MGLLLALVFPYLALATRMVPLAIEQLAGTSELIVHGHVQSVGTRRDAEGRVFTRVELEGMNVWKGRLEGTSCVVVLGGGILGDRQVAVTGQAEYAVGDEVVLFLVRNPRGEWVTVALEQGRFRVETDVDGQHKRASNLFWGVGPEKAPSGSGPRTPPGLRQGVLSLEELKRRVVEAVR
ncbi:MAG: hypothetical protein JNK85_00025 [Verrucomicrobiales bacterium]|nr:hypothetical protein [Verrucomicrobiales bacterium]